MIRVLGKGSFGEIRVARDQFLGREVAIKVIQAQFVDDPSVMNRFIREAETLAKLEHPHIIPIHDSGRLDDGRPYFSMRLINGETFEQRTNGFHDRHKRTNGRERYTLEEFRDLLGFLRDTAEAIAFAHERGVVHRDVKPSNVLISDRGETFLIDWGTAKGIASTEGQRAMDLGVTMRPDQSADDSFVPSETMHGAILGTPAYMSPEQAMGQTERVTTQSDIFGLGAALYFLLTGRPPHRGDFLTEVLSRAQQGEITSARSLADQAPLELTSICDRALAIDPVDRYPTAELFVADLQRYLDSSHPQSVTKENVADPTASRGRRQSRGSLWLAWSLVILLAGAAGGVYWHFGRESGAQAKKIESLQRKLDDALATPAVESTEPRENREPEPIESSPQYQALAADLKLAREQLEDAQQELKQQGEKQLSSEELVSARADEVKQLRQNLSALELEHDTLKDELEQTQKRLLAAQDQSGGDSDLVQQLNQQIADLKRDLSKAKSDGIQGQEKIQLHQTARDKLATEVKRLEQELIAARSKSDSLQSRLDQQAESMTDLRNDDQFHSHMDGDQLVELFNREGKKAQLVEPNHLEIKNDAQVSQLYVMANGDLLVSSLFDDGSWTTETVNEWNSERILSRAYLDSNQHVVLESEITATDGLSDRAVLSFFKSYEESIDQMRTFLKSRKQSVGGSASSVGREY